MRCLVRWREAEATNATKVSHELLALILQPAQIIKYTRAPITTSLLKKNRTQLALILTTQDAPSAKLARMWKVSSGIRVSHMVKYKSTLNKKERQGFTTDCPIPYTSSIHLYHGLVQKWQTCCPQVYTETYPDLQNLLSLLPLCPSLFTQTIEPSPQEVVYKRSMWKALAKVSVTTIHKNLHRSI